MSSFFKTRFVKLFLRLFLSFIKESYNHIDKPTYVNIKDLNENVNKKYTNRETY